MLRMSLDMNTPIPWLLCLATAAWFAFMAFRGKGGIIGWAVAGAVLGLITSTIIMGLGNAAYIAMSEAAAQSFRIKSAFLSVVAILVLGWIFSLSLHQHHLVIWRLVRRSPGPDAGKQ
jgi:hypothetical protein